MKITHLSVNQLRNPLGYDFSYIALSWRVEESKGTYSTAVRITVSEREDMAAAIYDSGSLTDYRECRYHLPIIPKDRTRYYWRIWIRDNAGGEVLSDVSWFETGKGKEGWKGSWIAAAREEKRMPILYKDFTAGQEVAKARLYIYGAGLYEAYLNQEKIGTEYLQPGYHSYDLMMEYQTYDVTDYIRSGANRLSVLLGEGWYKGRFGFDDDYRNLYGNRKKCLAERILTDADGSEEWLVTDGTWQGVQSPVGENGIYDGEWIDDTAACEPLVVEELTDSKELLTERSNPPVVKVKSFSAVSEIQHQDGYLLLDFGESITGWVEWEGQLEPGQIIRLSYGEVLQDKAFYNDNLRTAKAEFGYTSDGSHKTVRPHFTYYGFRYVKVEGLKADQKLSFTTYRIMSDLAATGQIFTAHEKINRLIANTVRSQQGNFLDIPTDCPQRDERMGWTGDVAIFAGTACFHMDSAAFFRHYMKSLYQEQRLLKGAVPFFVPKPKIKTDISEAVNPFYITAGACAWGDVATILPWTLYEYYGDRELLREQYPAMCEWTNYITGRARENAVPYLWQNDRQLGDWLALDNGDLRNPIGKTDVQLLASAFYYQSARCCYQAADVLQDGRREEFMTLTGNIKQEFLSFYFDDNQELRSDLTQTACAVLLTLKLYPEGGKEKLAGHLRQLLEANKGHLNTGFIGTPVLCPALSENGLNEMAYDLLLNEEYPGWLHEVNLGATTIWERWNSLDEEGVISSTGMNSLNHYAYGSIAEWMYRYMCGFRPGMGNDIKMIIKPQPSLQLQEVTGNWDSPYGRYVSGWSYDAEVGLRYKIEIPFNANAKVVFPNGNIKFLESGIYYFNGNGDCE